MRLIVVSLLLAVATFTTPACADPPNAFVDAYRRGDYAEVLRMTRSLAEQGHPAAQAALADLYLRGRGVPKDEAEAIRWFRRAAEQGYANAQVQLGALYGMGQGVPQDFAQSAIWYLRAAQAGHAHSQIKVGFLYFEGRGVPTDYISSYMWFNVAATNSSGDIHADAVEARDQISGLMTVGQIAEAQRLSRNWKPVKWTKGPPAPSPAAPDRRFNGSTIETVYHGTGFFVSQNGLVLTNAHVIEHCQHTSVRTGDKTLSVRVLARDASNDLALLASDLKPAPRAALRPSVRMGEEIVVFGYPLSSILASSGNITVGNISALAGIRDDSRYLQISAPVQQGNSGGPVLDRQGNVVGIVVGKLNALAVATTTKDIPQNVNFAIKSTVIVSFLDTQKVETAEPNAGTSHSTAELAERANKFTVQVECRP